MGKPPLKSWDKAMPKESAKDHSCCKAHEAFIGGPVHWDRLITTQGQRRSISRVGLKGFLKPKIAEEEGLEGFR